MEKYGINGKNYCRKYTPEIILNVMKKVGVKSMFILEN
ncbi:hypothetical protein PXO_01632 [Xanthomonas oryzae pv. oryzae PXO99A]|uniref:Uncharacterized protein n=1 Tax=Xanthomonas oryzae pv. oryzae (strain PXO99A) TaxID=360094 RepID=A0A0K0GLW8_XANOP|nr:hypothetical protein PXO_01632 [Xanthomonas oryzae pv. oryzae PXO99A]